MPRERAEEAFRGGFMLQDLARLKQKWGISIQALVKRASAVGQLTEEREQSLWRQIGARGWRTNEPVTVHPEQPALMRAMLARKYGEPPSVLAAAEDLGLHPVLMRSLAPDVAANPTPNRTDNVVSLRRRATSQEGPSKLRML
jgi:hypothetical protein